MKISMHTILLPLLLAAAAAHGAEPVYAGAADCRIVDPAPASGRKADWNGACQDGYASGPGALQWSVNGKEAERYEGMLARGLPNGAGIYQQADGALAQGTYRDNLLEGQGILVSPRGDKLAATFRQGGISGPVKYYEAAGDRYEGGWAGDGPHGAGVWRYVLGGSYSGQWRHGEPSGEGEITYSNGKVLKGRFLGSLQLVGASAVAAEAGNYSVKHSDGTGSHLRRSAGVGLRVPPNKSYDAMTPGQQQVIKQDYPILQADDAPPYPRGGNAELSRALSHLSGNWQESGRVRANVWVDENGVPQHVTLLKADSKDFGEQVAKMLMVIKYTPGRCAGLPCAMGVPFDYIFTSEY